MYCTTHMHTNHITQWLSHLNTSKFMWYHFIFWKSSYLRLPKMPIFAWAVLDNVTKCLIIFLFSLYHNTKLQLTNIIITTHTHYRLDFQKSFHEINLKLMHCLLFFPILGCIKRKPRDLAKLWEYRCGMYKAVQIPYRHFWNAGMHVELQDKVMSVLKIRFVKPKFLSQLQLHLLPDDIVDPEIDARLPRRPHTNNNHTPAACNCGRTVVQRDDPFELKVSTLVKINQ